MAKASHQTKATVLLVDEDVVLRRGLARLINQQPGWTVCCEADGARQAMDYIATARPSLVVTEISFQGKSSLEWVKNLHVLHPGLNVLVFSTHADSDYAERALRAGARGYVRKNAADEAILAAIRQVLSGTIYVSALMSDHILEIFSGRRPDITNSPLEVLTDREFEIFELIGKGCSTRETATRLNISPKTVGAHRQKLKAKLNILSSTDLIQQAVHWVKNRNDR